MTKKEINQIIKQYNEKLNPFYMVAHKNGSYGLCLYINGLKDDYGQKAFDNYAIEKGEPIRDKQGYVTYGSGYDWETAFMEAFKDDKNIKRVFFDSEESGFYCDGHSLDMMVDFGKRFKAICEDDERFTKIVSDGLNNQEIHRKEEERVSNSVRAYFILHPLVRFEMQTDDGKLYLEAGDAKKILDGKKNGVVTEKGVEISAEALLEQRVSVAQLDLFDSKMMRMITTAEPQQTQNITQKM